jgi:hypothetical protein
VTDSPHTGHSADSEAGQLTVLIIGYTLICLLLLTVVMAVSSVYIGHKKLLSVADSAALAAADSFELGDVSATAADGNPPAPVLSRSSVRAAAERYLSQTAAASRFSNLSLASGTGASDSRTAQVVLTAVVHPPLVNFLVPDGVPVTAVADARSRLVR